MCGINGIISLNGRPIENGLVEVDRMNTRLYHRGPDAKGTWEHPSRKCCFGQTRLSIIDLSESGNQPMRDEEGNCITFNGEIYNFKRLKQQYFKNDTFHSSSDTEVLLKMHQRFGLDMLQHIDGMFAFALWDEKNQRILAARDRSGKKPFYYLIHQGRFYFASEIKALLEIEGFNPKLDKKAFYHFLTFNVLPSPYTMFEGIKKLDAGQFLQIDKHGEVRLDRFWDVEYQNLSTKTEGELTEMVYDALESSVMDRLVSDVPIGAFLSGGVDSSAVVALMRKFNQDEIKTYSIGFEGQPGYDELKYAKRISETYGTTHFEKTVTKQDLINFLPKVVEVFDEPLSDTTAIPIYFLSQLARENNTKVVMTGDGADEIFAGYRNFMAYDKRYSKYNILLKTPKLFRELLASSYGLVNRSSPVHEILHRAKKSQELAWIGASGFKESTKARILSEDFKQLSHSYDSYEVVQRFQDEFNSLGSGHELNHVDWMCYMGYRFADADRYLFRADRLGMVHSVETRAPFMDYRLVNLALSIPSAYKIKNGEPKYILKKALEKILSDDVLYRKKQGFNVPIKEWAGDILTEYVADHAKAFSESNGLFDADEILNQVNALKSGNANYTNSVWTIYFLMSWMDYWKPKVELS
ncbi:asparagine synthase (glutamine-hydrolyzing) [Bacteroidota bacterium]